MTPTMITLLKRHGMCQEQAEVVATAIHNHWPGRLDICIILGKLFQDRVVRVVLEGE